MEQNLEDLKEVLFRNAMKGKWEEVVQKYLTDIRAHDAKITKLGDTALHIAVSHTQESVIEKLVKILSIDYPNSKKVLHMKNERSITPLHIAATLGSTKMCYYMASADPSLVSIRNDNGETPLFLAALHGNKDAFLCLHSFCSTDRGQVYENCRRSIDGETILHCAIMEDFFDLAFYIIKLYKGLVKMVNKHGFSPLHLLATKASAFKSGTHFGRWQMIIYHCVFVDQLKFDQNSYRHNLSPEKRLSPYESSYPDNYKTCTNFFNLLWKGIQVVTKKKETEENETRINADTENPQHGGTNPEKENLPENYDTCFNFVKVIYKAILIIILGSGSTQIRKIWEIKKKHVWSFQVLDLLLNNASLYQFADDDDAESSLRPKQFSSSEEGEIYTSNEDDVTNGNERKEDEEWREAPILMAAKNGVLEIVEQILNYFPSAIDLTTKEGKNIVHLAVEYRQPEVYKFLLNHDHLPKLSVLHKLDIHENGVLHLAAQFTSFEPITVPGLQMIWETKWFEFIKRSVPSHYLLHHNKNRETPIDIFTKSHEKLTFEAQAWLSYVSGSCSVVSGIIAAAAFSISANIADKEKPSPYNETVSIILPISSLLALCYSVTSLITFLAIQLSRYQQKDFYDDLPRKLLVGLLSLYASIAAMMIYASAAYFFVLKDKLKYVVLLVSAVSWLPFILGHLQLVVDLFQLYVSTVPNRYFQLRI